MPAEIQQRRKTTAKELAKRLGCSERTVRRIAAEPRTEFLARAAERRARALALRESGMTYKQIAAEMGESVGSVGRLIHSARHHAKENT
ncbi:MULTISPECIES: sigma factor-like helix-turn-helix DNA-binding protein [Kocuria]|jgi:DNA-directed RNA polymerase specialized sigma24 family protein|uniref:sigma factor-like helix-turn-helix DNA-binding protein n=1 Tax=Kocuria TaxID=57493 RepID=UPI0009E4A119|nr:MULTISPECIES: sigma factor-like helix-turn-helix DNA-binding protein [Kocuria]